jgi:hypothetical protein
MGLHVDRKLKKLENGIGKISTKFVWRDTMVPVSKVDLLAYATTLLLTP